jgi:hypothetical protein
MAAPQVHVSLVNHDTRKPCEDVGPALELVEFLRRAEVRLLQYILRVARFLRNAAEDRMKPPYVAFHQQFVELRFPKLDPVHHFFVGQSMHDGWRQGSKHTRTRVQIAPSRHLDSMFVEPKLPLGRSGSGGAEFAPG